MSSAREDRERLRWDVWRAGFHEASFQARIGERDHTHYCNLPVFVEETDDEGVHGHGPTAMIVAMILVIADDDGNCLL